MSKANFPKNLKYNKDFSWAKIKKDQATIGIIAPSAKKVKEFVFIKLPEKEKKIKTGQKYVSLEAVKWSGHLSSPISGEITDVNDSLFNEPSKINKNAYSSWIMKVKMSNPKETEKLMNSEEAEKYYGGK